MIRRSEHTLKFANKNKLEMLDSIFNDVGEQQQFYINEMWYGRLEIQKWAPKNLLKNIINAPEWNKVLYQQASSLVRAVKSAKTKKKSKPIIKNVTVELNFSLFKCYPGNKEFDEFVRISTPYPDPKYKKQHQFLYLPIKHHKHSLKFQKDGWKRKNTIHITLRNNQYYLVFFYEKEDPPKKFYGKTVGIDQGYKKLFMTNEGTVSKIDFCKLYTEITKKLRGSKNHKQIVATKNRLINQEINQFIEEHPEISKITIEDLKNVKRKSKFHHTVNNKMQYWSYSRFVRKLECVCQERGITLEKVSPMYTSQTCPNCGLIHSTNRLGEKFECIGCKYTADADWVGSVNILHKGSILPLPQRTDSLELQSS